jgi:hypothetical protein
MDDKPDAPFASLHRAAWLAFDGEPAAAEQVLRGVTAEPAASYARRQLIQLLRGAGRWADAAAVAEDHARAHPDDPEIAYYLAISLLGLGRYEAGWRLYEARRAVRQPRPAEPACPPWRGEAVGSLIVLDEQGFGDAIQFARFVPPLVQRGIEVTLVCRRELAALFESLGARVWTAGPPPEADAHVLLGSLPLWLGARLDTLPTQPYLRAPEDRRREWAARLPPAARIGVAPRGRSTHPKDASRSLPPVAAEVLTTLPGSVILGPEGALRPRDFADTAAVIERLDLVVTVDTAVAHVAGALGKACWVLLEYDPDWRWLHDRVDSPWYPSLRLYRQPEPGDWRSVLRQVRQDLGLS